MTYIQWFNIVQLFNIVSWFESVHNSLWDENLSNRKDGFPAFSFTYFLILISGSNQWVLRIICVEKWIGKYINTENVGSGFYTFAAKYNILCLRLCCIFTFIDVTLETRHIAPCLDMYMHSFSLQSILWYSLTVSLKICLFRTSLSLSINISFNLLFILIFF